MADPTGLVLTLDTATAEAAIGLCVGDGREETWGERVLAERRWTSRRRHSVELAPTVAELFGLAGARPDQVEAIAVSVGPGSYTGLRIALALAKGLALGGSEMRGQDMPVVGVPTLDILALAMAGPGESGPLVAVLDAGRGRLSGAWYPPFRAMEALAARPANWPDPGGLGTRPALELAALVEPPWRVAGEVGAEAVAALRLRGLEVIDGPAAGRPPACLAAFARAALRRGDAWADPSPDYGG